MARCAPSFPPDFGHEVHTTTDVDYSDHPLQRLDIFEAQGAPRQSAAPCAALVFVHGGGFVSGDKQSTEPFYRNVGVWAVQQGLVAFSLNYRLAPAHRWPAAAEDIAAALAWIAANSTRFNVDPQRMVLMGHSTGATHAATCIATAHQARQPLPVAALVLVSGTYALENVALTPNRAAYFGDHPATMASRSSADAIVQGDFPCWSPWRSSTRRNTWIRADNWLGAWLPLDVATRTL